MTSFESLKSAVAVGENGAFGGGDAEVGDMGGLFAGVTEVNGPEHVHFATDGGVVVSIAIGEESHWFMGGENRSAPGGHP